MNAKRIVAVALLVALCCPFLMAQKRQGRPELDKAIFEKTLIDTIGPKVLGYQFVLTQGKNVVSDQYGGIAQKKIDYSPKANLVMSGNTPINLGSLQKFITGTAFLNMMQHPTKWSPGEDYGLKTKLDMPIWGVFPKVWLDLIPNPTVDCPQIRCIKYRQMFQHRSGFNGRDSKDPLYKANNRTVIGYLQDKDGFVEQDYNQRYYANINFVMAGYLLPLYEKPHLAGELMNDAVKLTGLEQRDNYVRQKLGERFDQILHERIFDRMTPKINPSCDAENKLKKTAAYGYASKDDDKEAGVIASQIEKKGHCTGEGGYYMSARDFANYVSHFAATDLIVDQNARDMMFKEGMDPNDRLIWTSSYQSPWFSEKFNMPTIVWSNGIPAHGKTVLIRLPQNYYLTIFTNSDELDTGDLFMAGIRAFRAGMEHNFN